MRFSSLQSTSGCGRDGSLAQLSLVLAKAGLRDLERSPRRLLGLRMDAETMIKHCPCFMGVGNAAWPEKQRHAGCRSASLDRQ